jgi:hypothetical protein
MKKVEFVAVMYKGIDSRDVREILEKKVPLFVCTEIRNVPINYIAGIIPVDTYNAMFKVEPNKVQKPIIPSFLEDKIQFIEYKCHVI